MARMRDRVVHTEPDVVWATAATAIPDLRRALAAAAARAPRLTAHDPTQGP